MNCFFFFSMCKWNYFVSKVCTLIVLTVNNDGVTADLGSWTAVIDNR